MLFQLASARPLLDSLFLSPFLSCCSGFGSWRNFSGRHFQTDPTRPVLCAGEKYIRGRAVGTQDPKWRSPMNRTILPCCITPLIRSDRLEIEVTQHVGTVIDLGNLQCLVCGIRFAPKAFVWPTTTPACSTGAAWAC